ncbi:RNA polymerase factor sigma-32 [Sphingomonas sp. 3-13AW]|uniref:RNA polymerase factor sigma-32 n=1 Tax=Sphingomonas sp. 3-13AW TaxID=3050450 RepID=UPI003BB65D7E
MAASLNEAVHRTALEGQDVMRAKLPAAHLPPETSRYIARIMRIPLLTLDEEKRLTRLWRDERDAAARERVMAAHLRVAVKIAQQFSRYGIPVEDLMDEGAAGLSRAIDKFDPDQGFRFVTYASWWIRAAVLDLVMRTTYQTPMGTTVASKKLFFTLRKAKARLGILDDEVLSAEHAATIAQATGTTGVEVQEMDRRMRSDVSLDARNPETGLTVLERMVDQAPLADEIYSDREESEVRESFLREALSTLDARERHIVETRQLQSEPLTLDALSKVYGVTGERIRQIEARALRRLQKRVVELAQECNYFSA